MSLFEYFIIYVVIWWILFFISLPLGVRKSENLLPGQDSGAPEKTYLWKKFIIESKKLDNSGSVSLVLQNYM